MPPSPLGRQSSNMVPQPPIMIKSLDRICWSKSKPSQPGSPDFHSRALQLYSSLSSLHMPPRLHSSCSPFMLGILSQLPSPHRKHPLTFRSGLACKSYLHQILPWQVTAPWSSLSYDIYKPIVCITHCGS